MLRPVRRSAPFGVLLVLLSVGMTCNVDWGFADSPQEHAENAAPTGLHITVLDGEDGVNILKTKMAVKPTVEVRDRNNLPVSGVAVVFLAPNSGPRVVFAHGSNTFTTTTDASGRASVPDSRPVGRGNFRIKVNANVNGQTLTTSFAQTNYATVAAATSAGATVSAAVAGGGGGAAAAGISAGVIAAIVAGAAAAAVVTAVVLTRGSKKPTGTIGSAGSPTLSPP